MIFLFLIFGSFSYQSMVNGQVTTCSGTQHFAQPQSANYLWYPTSFDSTAPLFKDHSECRFQIDVPKGISARVILTLNPTSPSGASQPPVHVTNQFQKTEQLTTARQEYFYFTAPGGTIDLDTQNGQVQFGFKVDWMPYHTQMYNHIKVNQTDFLPSMLPVAPSFPVTVTADTRVSMTVISHSGAYFYQYLRGILIFDGSNIEAPCLGTAYDIYTGNTQFVSTGNKITVQFLQREKAAISPTLLWQDYENTKNIQQFQGMVCGSGDYCGIFSMDASKGPVALQSIYNSNYEEIDILTDLVGVGTMEVYIGGVTKEAKNAIAIYNAGTSATYLPQQFKGPLKTYVLMNGKATLNITRVSNAFGITKSFGRKGFIASDSVTQLKNFQYAAGVIKAPIGYTDAKFNVKITRADMSGNTFFDINGMKNGVKTSDYNFNSTNLPDTKNTYVINGDTLSVHYDSSKTFTTGMFLRFEVVQP